MKTILITGASSGFGKLTIPLLLDKGHRVVAALRGGEARLREVFGQPLIDRYAGRLIGLDLHVDKTESINAAQQFVESKLGGSLDVLINNAGYGFFGALEELEPAELRYQFEVNFFGVLFLTRALLPALRKARGRVLAVSSIAGRYTFPMYGNYSASKYALEAAFEGLYYELKPMGISVGLIEPGGFRTDFTTRSFKVAEKSLLPSSPYHQRTQNFMASLRGTSPRLGDPQRVARLIVRLCEQDKIPLRSPIGIDARFAILAAMLIPHSWRMKVMDAFFNRFVFKDAPSHSQRTLS